MGGSVGAFLARRQREAPQLPARQLMNIWHISCGRCPKVFGAPAACQWVVRHGVRQPLNR